MVKVEYSLTLIIEKITISKPICSYNLLRKFIQFHFSIVVAFNRIAVMSLFAEFIFANAPFLQCVNRCAGQKQR